MSFFLLWQNKNLELESDLHERRERCLIRGAYHLHGKTRNSGGKPNGLCHFFWKASENVAVKWAHFSRSWAVIGGDETFLVFLVCSSDLDILRGSLISHQVKFYSFMFMQKISTQVVCVNAKPSRFPRVN